MREKHRAAIETAGYADTGDSTETPSMSTGTATYFACVHPEKTSAAAPGRDDSQQQLCCIGEACTTATSTHNGQVEVPTMEWTYWMTGWTQIGNRVTKSATETTSGRCQCHLGTACTAAVRHHYHLYEGAEYRGDQRCNKRATTTTLPSTADDINDRHRERDNKVYAELQPQVHIVQHKQKDYCNDEHSGSDHEQHNQQTSSNGKLRETKTKVPQSDDYNPHKQKTDNKGDEEKETKAPQREGNAQLNQQANIDNELPEIITKVPQRYDYEQHNQHADSNHNAPLFEELKKHIEKYLEVHTESRPPVHFVQHKQQAYFNDELNEGTTKVHQCDDNVQHNQQANINDELSEGKTKVPQRDDYTQRKQKADTSEDHEKKTKVPQREGNVQHNQQTNNDDDLHEGITKVPQCNDYEQHSKYVETNHNVPLVEHFDADAKAHVATSADLHTQELKKHSDKYLEATPHDIKKETQHEPMSSGSLVVTLIAAVYLLMDVGTESLKRNQMSIEELRIQWIVNAISLVWCMRALAKRMAYDSPAQEHASGRDSKQKQATVRRLRAPQQDTRQEQVHLTHLLPDIDVMLQGSGRKRDRSCDQCVYDPPSDSSPHCLFMCLLRVANIPPTVHNAMSLREEVREVIQRAHDTRASIAGHSIPHWARQVGLPAIGTDVLPPAWSPMFPTSSRQCGAARAASYTAQTGRPVSRIPR
eukprot:2322384-Amphidinium_carterae.1